jgi:hypothetical protein
MLGDGLELGGRADDCDLLEPSADGPDRHRAGVDLSRQTPRVERQAAPDTQWIYILVTKSRE